MLFYDFDYVSYEYVCYWCGLVWVMINYMIVCGFVEVGDLVCVEWLCGDIVLLIEVSGFVEYFSLEIVVGVGGGFFFWMVVIWLIWVFLICVE